MTLKSLGLDEQLYNYLLSVSLREPELLRQLRAETARYPNPQMQIAPEQGQFMGLLVQLLGAQRAIEVGVFTGYSALWTALSLPADGELVACDTNADYTAVAQRYWEAAGVAGKIDLRLAPATEPLESLRAQGQLERFDFAFIDADKQTYDRYYEQLLPLLRPGGLIAIDNVLWSARVADPQSSDPDTQALQALNAKLHRDERIDLSLLPVADGLTLARKR